MQNTVVVESHTFAAIDNYNYDELGSSVNQEGSICRLRLLVLYTIWLVQSKALCIRSAIRLSAGPYG